MLLWKTKKIIFTPLKFVVYKFERSAAPLMGIWICSTTRSWGQTNLLSLICMFFESNGIKFWSHSFHLQNSGILQTRIDLPGDPMKMNFDNFQIQKWKSEIVRAQKVDHFFYFPFFASWVMVLELPKIVHFLQDCADLSKKSKSIKAIYLYPPEIPHHALSENNMFYRGLSKNSRDIEE